MSYGAKTELINSLPVSLPAREVVAEGARRGLRFTAGYVCKIRKAARARNLARPLPAQQHETVLRRAIVEQGLAHVRALLDEFARVAQ